MVNRRELDVEKYDNDLDVSLMSITRYPLIPKVNRHNDVELWTVWSGTVGSMYIVQTNRTSFMEFVVIKVNQLEIYIG